MRIYRQCFVCDRSFFVASDGILSPSFTNFSARFVKHGLTGPRFPGPVQSSPVRVLQIQSAICPVPVRSSPCFTTCPFITACTCLIIVNIAQVQIYHQYQRYSQQQFTAEGIPINADYTSFELFNKD
jgi:hypothetical protein